MGNSLFGPGKIEIHPTVTIAGSSRIHVTERLVIGPYGVIGENCVIAGRDIEIGQELYMLDGAVIGGGSRYERQSSLKVGHYLHMGRDAFINTARPVEIGHEVGLGTGTKIFTHGAYLSALDGFPVSFYPVTIGDRVWLPGAIVNPGVTIGSDVVVGVGSVVLSDVPSGSLAAGTPAKIIRQNAYPAPLVGMDLSRFWLRFFQDYPDEDIVAEISWTPTSVHLGNTIFHLPDKDIIGPATSDTERLRDQLRRYGIRFYSRPVDDFYEPWA